VGAGAAVVGPVVAGALVTTGGSVVAAGAAVVVAVELDDALAASVGASVVSTGSSVAGAPPPQPWIAKITLNAKSESRNARPVILNIGTSLELS